MIELMITLSVFAIFMGFVFTNLMNAQRISKLEDISLDMDRAANGALREITAIVKDAYLPVRSFKNGKIADLINDDDRGFARNSALWERALLEGRNFFPFCQPIDLDGSGDLMDADTLPYLGVVHTGVQVNDASYDDSTWALGATASLSPGLASLRPDNADLDYPQPPATSFNLTPGGAYGLVRFVPYVDTDVGLVTVTEGSMKCDFNRDGIVDPAFQYYVGDLEIYYPSVDVTIVSGASVPLRTLDPTARRFATMNMVLAPVPGQSTANDTLPPIFSLVAMDPGGSGFIPYDSSTPNSKLRFDALRIQFSMLNFRDGDWRGTGQQGSTKYYLTDDVVRTKAYESVVRLRNQ
jgi:hypothetical protein